jgi:hypothetical protein
MRKSDQRTLEPQAQGDAASEIASADSLLPTFNQSLTSTTA